MEEEEFTARVHCLRKRRQRTSGLDRCIRSCGSSSHGPHGCTNGLSRHTHIPDPRVGVTACQRQSVRISDKAPLRAETGLFESPQGSRKSQHGSGRVTDCLSTGFAGRAGNALKGIASAHCEERCGTAHARPPAYNRSRATAQGASAGARHEKGHPMQFHNRKHAAHLLATQLAAYQGHTPLVCATLGGAVPMGKIIAEALGGELDVVYVDTRGAPEQPG
jgi:hypothetical protein